MSITITRFHKFESGSLHGFLDISVPMWGTELHIKGCKVFQKDGKQWLGLPSREYQNDEGETKYQPIIGIEDKDVYKKFIDGVTQAWNEYTETQSEPVQSDGEPF